MKYKYIQGKITSDVMFEVYGKDAKELFQNAAEAMFETICQKEKVKPTTKVDIELKGDNLQDLLYNWLQQLIAEVDVEEMFFSKFKIIKIDETSLKAEIFGEEISPEKGETLVKAVTYHEFSIKKTKSGYVATISLDI